MSCPPEETLVLLLDGGIPPNQLEGIQAHLAGCATCRDAMAELETLAHDLSRPPAFDGDAHVRQVMRCLQEPRQVAWTAPGNTRRAARAMKALGIGASVVALAAAFAFHFRGPRDPRIDGGTFEARGAKAPPTLARDVGVSVLAGKDVLVRLASGQAVAPTMPFVAAYTNRHARPVYLLLFALDAANTVHWLYPEYASAADDPPSVGLERTDRERALPTSVVLEEPAIGPLRFVSVVTESPLHVSDIERRPASELAIDTLGRAFPDASIVELEVRVAGE